MESRTSAKTFCSRLSQLHHNFDGVFYLSEIISVSCFADQMFGFIHTYLARATDINPFPVLIQAWGVLQFIVGVLVLIHALRWYLLSALHKKCLELHLQSCEKS